MSQGKRRLTVTVSPELVEAGNRAVADGAAESLSAWVGEALREKIHRDHMRKQLDRAILDYEAEFGEITDDEVTAQARADREEATVVRSRQPDRGIGGFAHESVSR